MDEKTETHHISESIKIIEQLTGKIPSGFYAGRAGKNTRVIASQFDNFIYDSDDYGDDLPFYTLT